VETGRYVAGEAETKDRYEDLALTHLLKLAIAARERLGTSCVPAGAGGPRVAPNAVCGTNAYAATPVCGPRSLRNAWKPTPLPGMSQQFYFLTCLMFSPPSPPQKYQRNPLLLFSNSEVDEIYWIAAEEMGRYKKGPVAFPVSVLPVELSA